MVAPIFSGHLFFVSSDLSPDICMDILKRGGRVTTKLPPGTECVHAAIVPFGNNKTSSDLEQRTRGVEPMYTPFIVFGRAYRIPVVYDHWVVDCVRENRLLPFKGGADVVLFDPFMFEDLRFTTTQLPKYMKRNVICAMQFFGARYSSDLMSDTDVVVYTRLMMSEGDGLKRSPAPGPDRPPETPPRGAGEARDGRRSKLEIAREMNMFCVTPNWIQSCLQAGRRLPFPLASGVLPLRRSSVSSPLSLPTPVDSGEKNSTDPTVSKGDRVAGTKRTRSGV